MTDAADADTCGAEGCCRGAPCGDGLRRCVRCRRVRYDSILAERPLTDDERAVVAAAPRPGVIDHVLASQDQTDAAIRREIVWHTHYHTSCLSHEHLAQVQDVAELLGETDPRRYLDRSVHDLRAQVGGLDSDPMARLLAYRAFGRRDLDFFQRRYVEAGELVVATAALRGGTVLTLVEAYDAVAHNARSPGVAVDGGFAGARVRFDVRGARVTGVVSGRQRRA